MKEYFVALLKEYLETRDVHGVYKQIKRFKPDSGQIEIIPVTVFEFAKESLQSEVDVLNRAEMARSIIRYSPRIVSFEDVRSRATLILAERKLQIAGKLRALGESYALSIAKDDSKYDIAQEYLSWLVRASEPDMVARVSWEFAFNIGIVSLEQAGLYDPLIDDGQLLGLQKISQKQAEQTNQEVDDEKE